MCLAFEADLRRRTRAQVPNENITTRVGIVHDQVVGTRPACDVSSVSTDLRSPAQTVGLLRPAADWLTSDVVPLSRSRQENIQGAVGVVGRQVRGIRQKSHETPIPADGGLSGVSIRFGTRRRHADFCRLSRADLGPTHCSRCRCALPTLTSPGEQNATSFRLRLRYLGTGVTRCSETKLRRVTRSSPAGPIADVCAGIVVTRPKFVWVAARSASDSPIAGQSSPFDLNPSSVTRYVLAHRPSRTSPPALGSYVQNEIHASD